MSSGLCQAVSEPGVPLPHFPTLCSPEKLSEIPSAGGGKPPWSTPSPDSIPKESWEDPRDYLTPPLPPYFTDGQTEAQTRDKALQG